MTTGFPPAILMDVVLPIQNPAGFVGMFTFNQRLHALNNLVMLPQHLTLLRLQWLAFVIFSGCQAEQISLVNLEPVKNLILYDRSVVSAYAQDISEIISRRDSVPTPIPGLTAYHFAWGGEAGGPWTHVLCFYRQAPDSFQCEFLYEGEYEMAGMLNTDEPLLKGEKHYLGTQLTQLVCSLGPQVYLNRQMVRDLLVTVMEDVLHYTKIRKSYMDSLDFKALPQRDEYFNFGYANNLRTAWNKKFIQTLKKIKYEMTNSPDPNVTYFRGELINGVWKGTVRQFDHTGRYCIELDYLNGEVAYTIWI